MGNRQARPERRLRSGVRIPPGAPNLHDRRSDELTDPARMRRAIELAEEAAGAGDVPIGAVLVCGERTFEARNEKESRPDPTAHAELLAIRAAAEALGVWRLPAATLYVTKEPC